MKSREFWAVCRKLNNEERIDVLRRLMAAPGDGLTVGQVADMVRLEQPATSVYLSQLERDCGLLASAREGRCCVYRAEPDSEDKNAVELFSALGKHFRDECRGFVFFNGKRPKAPAFLSVLPALANESRVRVVAFVRKAGSANKASIMKGTGMSELNVRRHVACLAECGLLEINGPELIWREPDDELSRLFVRLSLS